MNAVAKQDAWGRNKILCNDVGHAVPAGGHVRATRANNLPRRCYLPNKVPACAYRIVCLKHTYLPSQLVRIGPVVIRIQPCNVFPRAVLERVEVIALHAELPGSIQYTDRMRKARCE